MERVQRIYVCLRRKRNRPSCYGRGIYKTVCRSWLVPKGIAWNDSNSLGQFYVLESKRNNYGEYKYYPLHMGRLTGTQYTNAELLGYVRIGKLDVEAGPIREGTQDILHRAGLGLFIVYNMGERNEAGYLYSKEERTAPVDPDTITEWGGQPRVIPDYARYRYFRGDDY